jgi:hypothetical protein
MAPTKCSKCNRPRRGHDGPTDDECLLNVLELGEGVGKYFDMSTESEQEDPNPLTIMVQLVVLKLRPLRKAFIKQLSLRERRLWHWLCVKFSTKWEILPVQIRDFWKKWILLLLAMIVFRQKWDNLKLMRCLVV